MQAAGVDVGPEGTSRVCWQCGHAQEAGLVCSACNAVQELPGDADLFAVIGIAPSLHVDGADLERRFYELSRLTHPDRFGSAPARAQAASLAGTALLNRAYKTLRDPVARGRYWLERHGEPLADDKRRVPPELANLVFEIQERLEELRATTDGESAARASLREDLRRLEERRAGCQTRLLAAYRESVQTPMALGVLKILLAEIAYLTTLSRNVENALAS